MTKRPEEKPPTGDGGNAAARGDGDRPDPGHRQGSRTGLPREIGGRKGPEPTRFGDWEKNGRCIDF